MNEPHTYLSPSLPLSLFPSASPPRSFLQPAQPCIFTSITPAWNNLNLERMARKVTSPLIFAHVRAAYPGMPVSEQNCHPFQVGDQSSGSQGQGVWVRVWVTVGDWVFSPSYRQM